MSEVERTWEKMRQSFGLTTQWHQLPRPVQDAFIQAINNMLGVLGYVEQQERSQK